MNWYAILLFLLASPWAWLTMGLLLGVFVYASIKSKMVSATYTRTTTIDSDDPTPAETRVMIQEYLSTLPVTETSWFWVSIMSVSWLLLVGLIGMPLACSFTILTQVCP